MILTLAVVWSLAANCQPLDAEGRPLIAPKTIVAEILAENPKLDTEAVNHNADGSVDQGLMQINNMNDNLLGLKNPFEKCESIRAGAGLLALFSQYNTGSRTKGVANGYALRVSSRTRSLSTPPLPYPVPQPPSCAPAWDAWALASCTQAQSQQGIGASSPVIFTEKDHTP